MTDTDSHMLYGMPFRIDPTSPSDEIHLASVESDPIGKITNVEFKTVPDTFDGTTLSPAEQKRFADRMNAAAQTHQRKFDALFGVTTTKWGEADETLDMEKLTLLMNQEQEKRDEMDIKLFVSMLKAGIRVVVGGWAVDEKTDQMALVIPRPKKHLLEKAKDRIMADLDAPWWARH